MAGKNLTLTTGQLGGNQDIVDPVARPPGWECRLDGRRRMTEPGRQKHLDLLGVGTGIQVANNDHRAAGAADGGRQALGLGQARRR